MGSEGVNEKEFCDIFTSGVRAYPRKEEVNFLRRDYHAQFDDIKVGEEILRSTFASS